MWVVIVLFGLAALGFTFYTYGTILIPILLLFGFRKRLRDVWNTAESDAGSQDARGTNAIVIAVILTLAGSIALGVLTHREQARSTSPGADGPLVTRSTPAWAVQACKDRYLHEVGSGDVGVFDSLYYKECLEKNAVETPYEASQATSPASTDVTTAAEPILTAEPPCDRRIVKVKASLAVHAEPSTASHRDGQLAPDQRVCVKLTSKSGDWIYVSYTLSSDLLPDKCQPNNSECKVGWAVKRFTVVDPDSPTRPTLIPPVSVSVQSGEGRLDLASACWEWGTIIQDYTKPNSSTAAALRDLVGRSADPGLNVMVLRIASGYAKGETFIYNSDVVEHCGRSSLPAGF